MIVRLLDVEGMSGLQTSSEGYFELGVGHFHLTYLLVDLQEPAGSLVSCLGRGFEANWLQEHPD